MKILWRSSFRMIREKITQFISLTLILGLGVAFFIGIRVTGSDMRQTAEAYYTSQKLMDARVLSNVGFSEDDTTYLASLLKTDVILTNYTDVLVEVHDEDDLAVRLISIEEDENLPLLVSGRMPKQASEVVVDPAFATLYALSLGDHLQLTSDQLTIQDVTIVGFAKSPLYLDLERGQTNIGTGKLQGFLLVDDSIFNQTRKTAADLLFSTDTAAFSQAYADQETALDDTFNSIKEELEAYLDDQISGNAQRQLDQAREEAEAALAEAQSQLDQQNTQLQNTRTALNRSSTSVRNGLISAYQAAGQTADLTQTNTGLIDQLETILIAKQERAQQAYTDGLAALEPLAQADPQQYAQQKQALEQANTTAQDQLTQALSSVRYLRQQQTQIDAGYTQVSAAETQVQSAQTALDAQRTETQATLDEQQKTVDALPKAEVYLQLRSDAVSGYADYRQDSDRIEAVGLVFPLIFFLVAALVTVTSVTRMVEEGRSQSGILKALGFSRAAIISEYTFFAFSAFIIALALGIGLGFFGLPYIIFNAYRIMYQFPTLLASFQWSYFLPPALLSFVCSVFVAWLIAYHTLKERPASLMRPQAPKPGKRILLERIPGLWKHLTFLQKVSMRNIFRSKSRFLMSLLGISGCVGLMITAFGLDTSINKMVPLQFNEIMVYDATVALNTSDEHTLATLDQWLENEPQITASLAVQSINGTIEYTKPIDATMLVIEQPDDVQAFFSLHNRKSKEVYSLRSDGVILSEKTASLLGVSVGDTITFETSDRETLALKVDGITENYVAHFIYISADAYKAVSGKDSVGEVRFLKLKSSADHASLASELLAQQGVQGVTFKSDYKDTYTSMMSSFNVVVWVIIAAAAALAFVVMVNITSMNISERTRELATLKVLGFRPKEMNNYILRESVMTELIGIVIGFVFGFFLHRYVLKTVEIDLIMFVRRLYPQSYLYASVLTIIFALIVNLFMNRRIQHVDMVESLKSIE